MLYDSNSYGVHKDIPFEKDVTVYTVDKKVTTCTGNSRPNLLCDEIESIQFPNGIVLMVSADKNIHYLDLFTFSLKANAILLLGKCGAKFLQLIEAFMA